MATDETGSGPGGLYRRPGFLMRRAHQISVSLFLEETAHLGLTATQYGALLILREHPELDQVGLAKLEGMDRSTTALVVSKLESAGLIERGQDERDLRRRVIVLTDKGRELLDLAAGPAQRAQERALSVFTPRQAATLLNLLAKFVEAFNENTRAPIVGSDRDEPDTPKQRSQSASDGSRPTRKQSVRRGRPPKA